MKYIKTYWIEILFLASFLLPFMRTVLIADGVRSETFHYGLELIVTYCYFFVPAVLGYFLYLKYRKNYWKYAAIFFYIAFLLAVISFGQLVNVAPKDYAYLFTDILPQSALIGLPINVCLAIGAGIRLFKK